MAICQLLTEALSGALPADIAAEPPRLLHCDRDDKGQFVRFAGLARARSELLVEHYRNGPHTAILVFSLFPPEETMAGSEMTSRLGPLLQWPGLAYLAYGFNRDQLIAAARRVIRGACAPLPAELMPEVGDVLRVMVEVRHWLENRLRNAEGALQNIDSAARGEKPLHRSYLDPVEAISDEHRDMVDRLWAQEVPAGHFAPDIGGLRPLRAAMTAFELQWQALEAARTSMRDAKGEQTARRLADSMRQVNAALAVTLKAIFELQSALTSRENG